MIVVRPSRLPAILSLVLGALLWVLSSGCSSTPKPPPGASPTPGPTAGAERPPANDAPSTDRIRPGDRISVSFSGTPSPPPKHDEQVREDGMISLPHVGSIMAAGKTVGALQDELQKKYVPDYYRNLTVTVMNEFRFFFVGGDVKNPGQKPYMPEMTVLKAVRAAGDFNDFANKNNVKVTRVDGTVEIVNCNRALDDPKRYDKPLFPGDSVFVGRSNPITSIFGQ